MANKDKDLMMSAPRKIKLSASSRAFYIICYVNNIPFSLIESAKLDGAGEIGRAHV